MGKLYRNGCLEIVLFAFYKGGKILLEKRQKDSRTITIIPSGTCEELDERGGDYRINAFNREVFEELKVKPRKFNLVTSCRVYNLKMNFHAFLVTGWDGDIPEFLVDDGQRSDLIWTDIHECQKILTFDVSRLICKKLEDFIG